MLQPDQQTFIDATLRPFFDQWRRRTLRIREASWYRVRSLMAKQPFYVTPRQVAAARLMVKRSAINGRPVSEAVLAVSKASISADDLRSAESSPSS